MRILILGGHGQLGGEFAAQLSAKGYDILAPRSTELDLSRTHTLEEYLMSSCSFDYIINCAAWTDVKAAELPINFSAVRQLNATVPNVLAHYSNAFRVPFVHISSDYVFGGLAQTPYTESSPMRPQSTYGITKADGDINILSVDSRAKIIRTSSLYGSKRPFLSERTKRSFVEVVASHVSENKPMSVRDDLIMTPTPVGRLVELAIQNVLFNNDLRGVIHMTPQGSTTWWNFASFINQHFNWKLKQLDKLTTPFDDVPRPIYSVLENEKLRYWGLDHFADWSIEFQRTFPFKNV